MNTKLRNIFNGIYIYGIMAIIAMLMALVFASHSEAQERMEAASSDIMANEIIAGTTNRIRIPYLGVDNGSDYNSFSISIINASGSSTTSYSSSSESPLWVTAETSVQQNKYLDVYFEPPMTYTGYQAIFSASNPYSNAPIVDTARIIAANKIKESTMFTLASAITRDATWSVSSPIIRQSSAEYQTALVEEFHTERGDQNRFHVVLYDQNSSIAGFFQKGYHFWVSTYAEALTVLGRGVPDGDTDRYIIEE